MTRSALYLRPPPNTFYCSGSAGSPLTTRTVIRKGLFSKKSVINFLEIRKLSRLPV